MKTKIETIYQTIQEQIEGISTYIYEHPEDGNKEFAASSYLCEQLAAAGFVVQYPYGSLSTAFRCELKGTKQGPTIAFLAEYDALPGYGESHDQLAHACGHNWIAAVCAGVGLLFAQMKDDIEGSIVIMGTPAEETSGGKCVLVEEHAFDDIDVAFQLHLGAENNAHVITLAMKSLEFTFKGKAAHAAAYPHLGVNALDAVNLTFTGISYLRQQLQSDARIHGIITKGGDACNIIPDLCTCQFYVRASKRSYMEEVAQKVIHIAEGASLMSGAVMEVHQFENTYHDLVNLESLQQLYVNNAKKCGVGDFVDSDEHASGSSDVGNVSHVCPMMYCELALGGPQPAYAHDVKFLEYLTYPCADDKLRKGVISLCMSVFDLYKREHLLMIQQEFVLKTKEK